MGLSNPFVKSMQFVKSNINYCKEYGMKISKQNTLKYTDMKKQWIMFNELKNKKLYVRRSTSKLAKFLNVTCF